jgi:hypothetical protein
MRARECLIARIQLAAIGAALSEATEPRVLAAATIASTCHADRCRTAAPEMPHRSA